MRRREFITLFGSAAAWPEAVRAQQPERMRRIGVLMNAAADDPEGQTRIAAFHQGLQEWGWTPGRNAQIDIRWGAVDTDGARPAGSHSSNRVFERRVAGVRRLPADRPPARSEPNRLR
jgi:putative ABC transport system substrate-binding protein